MIPPRWVFRAGWWLHNLVHRLSGGRLGTSQPRGTGTGVLFLSTIGRRSGQLRRNALNYLEEGPNLLLIATNAGASSDPSWWLNLKAQPQATVEVGGVSRSVRARRATLREAAAAWPRWTAASAQYEEYRRTSGRDIPIIVLEPGRAAGQSNVPKEPPADP